MEQKKIRFLKGLSTGMVVAAMAFAFLIAGIRIFGVQVYGVLTGSMEPTYPTGSLIYVSKVDASDLRVNDVITFSISPNVIATHRIVEIVPNENNPSIVRYRTKGDANSDVDAALVSANNIIGKVNFAVPKLGYLASYIQQPPGIYVAIFVCGLMIAFVFYTDSLENKAQPERGQSADHQRMGLTANINTLSKKLLGKPLFKEALPEEPLGQGYTPRAQQSQPYPVQQPAPYPTQQMYAQYGMQPYPQQPYPPYPPQGYPQQMPQQPYGGGQAYPQGYPYQQQNGFQQVQPFGQVPPQQYSAQGQGVQQGYGQVPYQQSMQGMYQNGQQTQWGQNAQAGLWYPEEKK